MFSITRGRSIFQGEKFSFGTRKTWVEILASFVTPGSGNLYSYIWHVWAYLSSSVTEEWKFLSHKGVVSIKWERCVLCPPESLNSTKHADSQHYHRPHFLPPGAPQEFLSAEILQQFRHMTAHTLNMGTLVSHVMWFQVQSARATSGRCGNYPEKKPHALSSQYHS